MTTTTTTTRTERILILYGSQNGKAEQVAQTWSTLVAEQLTPEQIRAYTGSSSNNNNNNNTADDDIHIETVGPLALDDFLQQQATEQQQQQQQQPWTRIVLVCVSSFGLGHAPKNARKFRKLCDAWNQQFKDSSSNNNSNNNNDNDDDNDDDDESDKRKPLEGLQFAMLGLGSSKYSTYQKNPMAICDGLMAAGATLVGDRGSADAAAGDDTQQEQINEWQDTLWQPLAQAIVQVAGGINQPLSEKELQEMKNKTVSFM